jgi:hypothetical protein
MGGGREADHQLAVRAWPASSVAGVSAVILIPLAVGLLLLVIMAVATLLDR